jgi:predicted RNase H-like HicB family nuclease
MQVLILIEPKDSGGFLASAGEPFRVCVEAASAEEAASQLESALRQRLQSGSRLAVLNLENGQKEIPLPLSLEWLPDDDWFFQTMREAIKENRDRENETER